MIVIVEQFVEWRLAGETEVLGENLPYCHFVHHKSHMACRGLELGPPPAVGSRQLGGWTMTQHTRQVRASQGSKYVLPPQIQITRVISLMYE
jgi:hypothetical protein